MGSDVRPLLFHLSGDVRRAADGPRMSEREVACVRETGEMFSVLCC